MSSEKISALRALAERASKCALVPYSGRADAAVLLLSDGSWVPGVRVESASFSLTIPPLVNAVTTVLAAGRTDIVAAVLSRPLHPAERAYASASRFLQNLHPRAADALVDDAEEIPAAAERLSPFTGDCTELEASAAIAAARAVADRAYVPESAFPVGCLVRIGDAGFVPGVNVEHSDWGHILCAERNALGTCVSYGLQNISEVWVTCLNDPEGTPCGACRQILVELAPTATLWMDRGKQPPSRSDPLSLLPGSFSGKQLLPKN